MLHVKSEDVDYYQKLLCQTNVSQLITETAEAQFVFSS